MLTLTASLSDWLVGDGTIPALAVGDELATLLAVLPHDRTASASDPGDHHAWVSQRPDDELCADYVATGPISFVDQHQYGGVLVVEAGDVPVAVPLGPTRSVAVGEVVSVTGYLAVDPYYWWTLVQTDDRDRIYDEGERRWLVRKLWGARHGPDDPDHPSRLVLEPFQPIDKIPRWYVGGREKMPEFLLQLELLGG